MNWRAHCGVVIPCLDEAATVGQVVSAVIDHLPNVLVVDDGSIDATGNLAAAAGATVLRHSANRGKGAAISTGLSSLHHRGFQWAVLMDGDGQHAAEDIPLFLQRAELGGARLIVGSRMAQPNRIPWVRRQANRWMSWWLSRLTGQCIPDSQCGFRLLHLPSWTALHLETAHFEMESEMLWAFLRAGYSVDFLPVRVIYGSERSKIRPFTDGWRWLAWCWKAGGLNRTRGEARWAPG